ncbi:PemI [Clostridium botulinum]|nr:PemI [Clostridium botulinum]
MIKNVTFNKGGSGASSGRIILPAPYLELMKVTKKEPEVEVTYKDGKIIIEKKKE